MQIERYRRGVSIWLLFVAGMVLFMIIVGGLTRLTQSGLSMVEWRPLMGTIPPITEAEWLDVFAKYKAYPEYQKVNKGMSLSEFKPIFYFEYSHRILGRLIGLVFALPAVFFWIKKAFPKAMIPKMLLLFVLGGAQGVIGWWMVKSGLVDRPDVSHYRLTLHLGMAVSLYIALLWIALKHWKGNIFASSGRVGTKIASFLLGMVFLVILSGGLVAGLNAGLMMNTFPLMNGQWIPNGLYQESLGVWNISENRIMLQFNHRYLALGTGTLIIGFWAWLRTKSPSSKQRWASHAMLFAVLLQICLGITTLLTLVWIPVASMHQTGAVILISSLVWLNVELRS